MQQQQPPHPPNPASSLLQPIPRDQKRGLLHRIRAGQQHLRRRPLYLNPVLSSSSSGSNCDTQLFLGYGYCVGIAAPTPTQAGIGGGCNDCAEALEGDYCVMFAQEKNITAEELYVWNPVLGDAGSGCETE